MNQNQIKKKVLEFYSELIENKNHRFESWEHCFLNFNNAFNKNSITDTEKDILSLHLSFYLASWGMYRGSSFILQKDYKVFYPIIDLLFNEKNNFSETKISDVLNNGDNDMIKSYVSEYIKFDDELSKILDQIRLSVKQKVASNVSYTLKTKIILGTYGSIPAYDRFFEDGLRVNRESGLIISYSRNGIFKLLKFTKDNLKELYYIKRKIKSIQKDSDNLNNVDYPLMKIIDMYFWKIGFDISQK